MTPTIFRSSFAVTFATVFMVGQSASAQDTQRFDFQPSGAGVEAGFVEINPDTDYSVGLGYGFTTRPRIGVNGRGTTFLNGKLDVQDAIPDVVRNNATLDNVADVDPFTFRTDVTPSFYDVTIWLGDVTSPTHKVRAIINGEIIDVERLDINHTRGNFWEINGPGGTTYLEVGNAVPRTVRVDASGGFIEVRLEGQPGSAVDTTYDYLPDECPNPPPPPSPITKVLVPAFSAVGLQALTLHPADEAPLSSDGGALEIENAPNDPDLQAALDAFNAGDIELAEELTLGLSDPALDAAKAHALFFIAGHPGFLSREPELLAEAETLLLNVLAADPTAYAAEDLLLQIQLAADAEKYRRRLGYAEFAGGAAENLGRSCSLVEQFLPGHPYFTKGQILYLRNRGGLDPRRCTMSWEVAQDMANQLDPSVGNVNPFVHVYATDEWVADGNPWSWTDWGSIAGTGPDWARTLMTGLNTEIDLFEWWIINRQSAQGDIGGGWTDDVEIVPAFGLIAFVLRGMSPVLSEGTLAFNEALWSASTNIVHPTFGYQIQYADVEHTAEPTGNSLPLYPMVSYGDPLGMERILRSTWTIENTFMMGSGGHRHFIANHMSATQIGNNPNHHYDIPLDGRAFSPVPWLVWYSGHPQAETLMLDWMHGWAEDAARTDHQKPAGVFPNAVNTQVAVGDTDHIGLPGGDWWGANTTYGQYGPLPGYHYYLYNMMGYAYLRTGDPAFRAPFDELQAHTQAWAAAGSPSYGSTPPMGEEEEWAGAKLAGTGAGAMFELARTLGVNDWEAHLQNYGTVYGTYVNSDVTDESNFVSSIQNTTEQVVEKWPYRTTEGVMTDRILLPGWFSMIPFYIGSGIVSVYFGMPVHAVTWSDTGRLFAASVTESTDDSMEASVFLFSDASRDVALNVWGMELGGSYVLEAGPISGLGQPISSVEQSVPFTLTERGQAIGFTLPGRQEYGVRIVQTAPGGGAQPLLADVAVAPRDIVHDGAGTLTVTVHNIGTATATNVDVELRDASGALLDTTTIGSLDAPTDLSVPSPDQLLKTTDVTFNFVPSGGSEQVTVILDPADTVAEVTSVNNNATAWVGAAAPNLPPPMIIGLVPNAVQQGGTLEVEGRNFQDGVIPLSFESPTTDFTLTYVDDETLALAVGATTPPGTYPFSLRNLDGKTSNLTPLTVTLADPVGGPDGGPMGDGGPQGDSEGPPGGDPTAGSPASGGGCNGSNSAPPLGIGLFLLAGLLRRRR